jgi:trans-2,3-dihydro-3-hydroxyanthranilate isomerase
MRRLHYQRVNVFTDQPFGGNPLMVFTNGRGVASETMQAIAKEMNLSEITFVLPPDDPQHDYRVRIFTPLKELPIAGHPTVGTAFVLAWENLIEPAETETKAILEEGVGPVAVRIKFCDQKPFYVEMPMPLPTFGPRLDDRRAEVAETIGLTEEDLVPDLPIEVVSCGVPLVFVPLNSLEAIRAARPRPDVIERVLRGNAPTEVYVFTLQVEQGTSTVHSRMFAPFFGIPEDPATGAASGPLGSYLVRYGAVPRQTVSNIVIEQGIEMGRPSVITARIERQSDEITGVNVGGRCQFTGEGFYEL